MAMRRMRSCAPSIRAQLMRSPLASTTATAIGLPSRSASASAAEMARWASFRPRDSRSNMAGPSLRDRMGPGQIPLTDGCSIRLVGRLGRPVKDTVPEEGQVLGSRGAPEGPVALCMATGASEHGDPDCQPGVVDEDIGVGEDSGRAQRLHGRALQHGRGACPKPGGEAAVGLFLENFDHVLGASQGPAHAALGEAVLDELVAVALNGAHAAALGPGRQPVAVIQQALGLTLKVSPLLPDELSMASTAGGFQGSPPEWRQAGPLAVDAGLVGRGGRTEAGPQGAGEVKAVKLTDTARKQGGAGPDPVRAIAAHD